MIAKLEWTQSNAQQNIEQLRVPQWSNSVNVHVLHSFNLKLEDWFCK